MDRDIPSFNRAVMQRIYAKNHDLHLKRLKNIKSGITSHKSYQKPNYSNLTNSNSILGTNYQTKLPQYNNLKKQFNEDSKNTKIQRQNALLFQKMIKIMKRPDKNNDPNAQRYAVTTQAAKQRISMQFSRINQQNKALFHRLEQQKPTIDTKKLEQQRIKNLNILKFLGKYPNQQALQKVNQSFNTFDLRSRKMNSTSNRIYNNLPSQSYEDEPQYEENYYRFKNQMQEYDHQIRQLKNQHQRANKTIQKLTSTTQNYYNPRRGIPKQRNDSIGQINSYEMKKNIPIDEPTLPNRRKFLSQGTNRRTMYEQKFIKQPHQLDNININKSINEAQHYNDQPYPYHLNHPSNNLVIQDRNSYNKSKDKTLESIRSNNPIKGIIQPNIPKPYIQSNQRKLNSKNSKGNLIAQVQSSIRPQMDMYENEFQSSVQQQFEQQNEPSPKVGFMNNKKTDNQNKKHSQENIKVHPIKSNMILLYRTSISLDKLLVQQEKQELINDIIQYSSNRISLSYEKILSLLNRILIQYSPELSIYRLSDCYKMCINNRNGMESLVKKKKYNQRINKGDGADDSVLQMDENSVGVIREFIEYRFSEIGEVQIPQQQGSILLQQIDYDYKYLIRQMVKIQKEVSEQMYDKQLKVYKYRLVIILKDEQVQRQYKNQQKEQKEQKIEIKQYKYQHEDKQKNQELNQNKQQQQNQEQNKKQNKRYIKEKEQQNINHIQLKQQNKQQQNRQEQNKQKQNISKNEQNNLQYIPINNYQQVNSLNQLLQNNINNNYNKYQEQPQIIQSNILQSNLQNNTYIQALEQQLI